MGVGQTKHITTTRLISALLSSEPGKSSTVGKPDLRSFLAAHPSLNINPGRYSQDDQEAASSLPSQSVLYSNRGIYPAKSSIGRIVDHLASRYSPASCQVEYRSMGRVTDWAGTAMQAENTGGMMDTLYTLDVY